MRCESAREALSARLDNESEGAIPADVDAHLEQCSACCAWYVRADLQARELQRFATQSTPDLSSAIAQTLGEATGEPFPKRRGMLRRNVVNTGLAVCGLAQVGVATAQMAGAQFGMASHMPMGHAMPMSDHLMNETTAWALALGVLMIAAAWWRQARTGLLLVLGVFAVMLGGYVIRDALDSGVTAERIVSHLPVFIGLLFALILVRKDSRPGPGRVVVAAPDLATRPRLVQNRSAA